MDRQAPDHTNKKGIFTRPLTAETMDVVACVGFLVFGSSGFVNVLEGVRFPWYKIASLALGVAWSTIIVIQRRRQRNQERSDRGDRYGA